MKSNIAFYLGKNQVNFDFKGENISTDGAALLLEKVERNSRILRDFAGLMPDKRKKSYIDHSVYDMLKQRVFLNMLGYEDCNDEKRLRDDAAIKLLFNKGLASQPTLSRFENSMDKKTAYRLCEEFLDRYIASIPSDKRKIVIDIDTTHDVCYGEQQGSLFNGFYDDKVYIQSFFLDGETGQTILPLLLPGNSHSTTLFVAVLKRVVARIRKKMPAIRIEIRADAGFSTPKFYTLAKTHHFFYCLGLSANERLMKLIDSERWFVDRCFLKHGEKFQYFTEKGYDYQAKTWEEPQTVYAKVESTGKGNRLNIRFFVSNFEVWKYSGDEIYWDFYTKRGDRIENRIKEIKTMCNSDRLSCSDFWANFMRLFVSVLSYELFLEIKKRIQKTTYTEAKHWLIDNIRLFLLKIGAVVSKKVKHVSVHLSSSFRYQELFTQIFNMS